MSDIISPDTSLDLAMVAREYRGGIECQQFVRTTRFAEAYLGKAARKAIQTLITGDTKLAISVDDTQHSSLLFLNVDIIPEGPASIVTPGFYTPHLGELARPILRPLTEGEGRALVEDIQSSMKQLGITT